MITPLQWEYLEKPKSICILSFENDAAHRNALHWVDTIWRIPWEVLYVDVEKEDNVVPLTIVIPADMLKKFKNPVRGMVGTFEARIIIME